DLVEQEYANLATALRFALDQQASILDPYHVLSSHLDHLRDHARGRELDELVLDKLKRLPPEVITGQRGYEFSCVIHNIGTHQLERREFDAARASYEKALAILDGLHGLDPKTAGIGRACFIDGLGTVALRLCRFAEAE